MKNSQSNKTNQFLLKSFQKTICLHGKRWRTKRIEGRHHRIDAVNEPHMCHSNTMKCVRCACVKHLPKNVYDEPRR